LTNPTERKTRTRSPDTPSLAPVAGLPAVTLLNACHLKAES